MESEEIPLQGSSAEGGMENPLAIALFDGIDPSNIFHHRERCAIKLWQEWAGMLETLPFLGEVLILTGNNTATLAETRTFPKLRFSADFLQAQSDDSTLDYELGPWFAAAAVIGMKKDATAHQIEFYDIHCEVFHKICLTPNSQTDKFIEWVQYHQAINLPSPPASGIPPHRWKTVQQRHWFEYDAVETVDSQALTQLLIAASGEGQRIAVVVGHENAVQKATFIPQQIHSFQSWTYTGDATTGLHYRPLSFAEVIVHQQVACTHQPPIKSLRCFDDEGVLQLVVVPPDDMRVEEWNSFLDASVTSKI